jgi:hypothetical protein
MMGQLHKEMEAAGNTEGSKEGIKQVNFRFVFITNKKARKFELSGFF